MSRHLIVYRLLLELLLPLILVLIEVVGHFAIVLLLSLFGSRRSRLLRRLHIIDGLIRICLHEVLWLSRGQFTDFRGPRHSLFGRCCGAELLIALLTREDLPSGVLCGPVLH